MENRRYRRTPELKSEQQTGPEQSAILLSCVSSHGSEWRAGRNISIQARRTETESGAKAAGWPGKPTAGQQKQNTENTRKTKRAEQTQRSGELLGALAPQPEKGLNEPQKQRRLLLFFPLHHIDRQTEGG